MQVNVKELTGVLHLRLVFMIVLVLQSFLAVFSSVLSSPNSKPTPSISKCKCDRCFEPLVQLPS